MLPSPFASYNAVMDQTMDTILHEIEARGYIVKVVNHRSQIELRAVHSETSETFTEWGYVGLEREAAHALAESMEIEVAQG